MLAEHWENYVFNLVDLSPRAARRRFRDSIKSEWGGCAYCGRSHDATGTLIPLTLDHVRPRTFGGSSLRSNLVPACRGCNERKGSARDWRTWYSQQEFYCAGRAARIEAWLRPSREWIQGDDRDG
jgi:5-methylcytosine-specific restriction endonuclease McrA